MSEYSLKIEASIPVKSTGSDATYHYIVEWLWIL
jgi:hypothetical protein